MNVQSDQMRAQHCYHQVQSLNRTLSVKKSLCGLADNLDDIRPNMVFTATPGRHYDPRLHADEAYKHGARVMVCEGADGWKAPDNLHLPIHIVSNLSPLVGHLAHWLNGSPSEKMRVFATTGTNGKTSMVWALSHTLSVLQHLCGVIGTLGWGLPNAMLPTPLTTPSAANIQRYLAALLHDKHCTYAAIEASSIALDQFRLNGCQFYCTLFTHLTHDHLDYHESTEHYFKSKMKLFCDFPSQHALINMNDPYGQKLWQDREKFSAKQVWGVIHQSVYEASFANAPLPEKDRIFVVHGQSAKHFTLTLPSSLAHHSNKLQHFHSTWMGSYNVENLSLVAIALGLSGFAWESIARAICQIPVPPGRLEKIELKDHPKMSMTETLSMLPNVYIDYAHTPDALAKALQCLSIERDAHHQGVLWCVFGCGGNRDRDKRATMGDVAKRYADRVIATSDNPRDEDPLHILRDIYPIQPPTVIFEMDRQKAIFEAIHSAQPKDCVLIAGKGHEEYQEIAGRRLPFSDRHAATAALYQRLERSHHD